VLRTEYDPRSEPPRHGVPGGVPVRRPRGDHYHGRSRNDELPSTALYPPYADQAEEYGRTDEDDSSLRSPPPRNLGPLGVTLVIAVILFTFGAGAAAFALLSVQPRSSGGPAAAPAPVEVASSPVLPSVEAPLDDSTSASADGRVVGDPRREQAVAQVVAQVREEVGCRQRLRVDGRLRDSARAHSGDMASRNFFSQTGSDNSSPEQRMKQVGYDDPASENIARGQGSPRDVVQAWLNSPQNRRNMLDCAVRAIGVGFAVRAGGDSFWTMDMGR
jgi:uncharacterized protein YkwD